MIKLLAMLSADSLLVLKELNLINDDVFRIIRPNINSGTSIYYRLVIPGSMEVFSA